MAWHTLIDSRTLAAHLQDGDWLICDCRFDLSRPQAGRQDYHQAHIPGAHYLHLDQDLAGPVHPGSGRHPLPVPETLAQRLGAVGMGHRTQVVAYDDAGGMIAARLWWLLRWLGHDAVAVLDGGWQQWLREQWPVSAIVPAAQPQRFVPRPQRRAWLASEEVRAALQQPSARLIDARAPARFRGECEPLDPVAGHVPGACNRPCQDNLDAQGCLRPPGELRAAFQALAPEPAAVIHMCGSGVTACHNQLAMEVAGLPGSRLYAGSWSEWIADPDRPVATGPASG